MVRKTGIGYISSIWQKSMSRPFAVSGVVSFLFLLFQAINLKYKWFTDETMTTWGIIVPALIFVVSVIAFIFLAPYQIYKEQKRENEKLKEENKKLNNGILVKSKTETLLEMRQSKFYDVIVTLDEMREQLDCFIEANPIVLMKNMSEEFLKDYSKIIGVGSAVDKMITNKSFNLATIKSMNTTMKHKWGPNMSNPNDPKTIEYLKEAGGILKHHKKDIFTLARKNIKNYEKLDKMLSQQRRLILCDYTFNSIERYLFYLEGYGNIYMSNKGGEQNVNLNALLTPEQKSQFANFKNSKNILLAKMVKDVAISIDKFISESSTNPNKDTSNPNPKE
jgi:hypothetical protein